jgi:DNA-binding GntR family transcriptional regulator
MANTADEANSRGGDAHEDLMTHAYHRLRDLLVWGRLAPGVRIVEKEVAVRLGISRTPLRAALQRLQQEGYIDAVARGRQTRWVVTPLTEDDAHELFSIVGAVEGLAAAGAARRPVAARREVVEELTELNEALREVSRADRPDRNAVFDLDMEFHRRYVELAGRSRVRVLHQAIKPQAERYVRLYIGALVDEIHESVEEHALIIHEIERGDPAAAKRAVESNWYNAAERLGGVIRDLGERGNW